MENSPSPSTNRSSKARAWKVAPLLFGSGTCALVYQIAWQREFRLIFGASTAASAAVLAIFIGGLGAGGLLLGRRADRHPRPLELYARLEALIALTTATTPGLLWLVRLLYVKLGGTVVLGLATGTIARLVLASLVLAVPTLLMGGTLPAAARGVELDEDHGRRGVAALYGMNTIGAVVGSVLSTFYLLELVGTRRTLWIACVLNLLIAGVAWLLSRRLSAEPASDAASGAAPSDAATTAAPAISEKAAAGDASDGSPATPAWFTLTAAGVVGFAFFLMEMVWYRMLGPLLGGTVFSFGLILAVALVGIGVGGAAYSLLGERRAATLGGFSATCLLEAAAVVLPFALGDRLAILTVLVRPLGNAGFLGFVAGWSIITGIVVLPAALVAGYQFPLLIALLGKGRKDVGRQIGLAYATNTVGAMVGSLAGGFGLLPLLTAPGCWRLVAYVLVALGLGAILLAARSAPAHVGQRRWAPLFVPLALSVLVLGLTRAEGPTAAWRHSQIGVGRVGLDTIKTPNDRTEWKSDQLREVQWEAEGVESSVALGVAGSGYYFVINGKIDGNSVGDASTQVMAGLMGGVLHPKPTRAMVIGLGTGSTAGWLGAIPSMERVDVVELEPAVLRVARDCAPVNQHVLDNPKVHITVGDARETLLTTPSRYNVIFSEPSNPYRAGIASLFTQEFYGAVLDRMDDDGLFLQWVQAYHVDAQTVRTIYATIASVFPHVETWQMQSQDILMVASRSGVKYDAKQLAARIAEEPYRSALFDVWRVDSLEGLLAHHVARAGLARAIRDAEGPRLNTDDRTRVEFGFARGIGGGDTFEMEQLIDVARARGEDRPEIVDGGRPVDWARVEDERVLLYTSQEESPHLPDGDVLSSEARLRGQAQAKYVDGELEEALALWKQQPREPQDPTELALVAETMADKGDEACLKYAEALRKLEPAEADAVLARLRHRQGREPEAADALVAAFTHFQTDPWPFEPLMERATSVAVDVARADKTQAPKLFETLMHPFAVRASDWRRLKAMLKIGWLLGPVEYTRALAPIEPHVPWEEELLRQRADAYAKTMDPRANEAAADWARYAAAIPHAFRAGLVPSGKR